MRKYGRWNKSGHFKKWVFTVSKLSGRKCAVQSNFHWQSFTLLRFIFQVCGFHGGEADQNDDDPRLLLLLQDMHCAL